MMMIVLCQKNLKKILQVIEQNPDINFIYHPAKCEMVNEGFSYVTQPIEPQEISTERILLANKIGGMPMVAIKKRDVFKNRWIIHRTSFFEDYDFLLKLLQEPSFTLIKLMNH